MTLINAIWEPTVVNTSACKLLLKISPVLSTTELILSKQKKEVIVELSGKSNAKHLVIDTFCGFTSTWLIIRI